MDTIESMPGSGNKLACDFGLDCSHWSRVKTDLHIAGPKLRWNGEHVNNGLRCGPSNYMRVRLIQAFDPLLFCTS